MKPNDYLKDQAPAPGSSSYYSLRVADRAPRALALYVLMRELYAIQSISDDGVAHAKLAWWRTELAKLDGGGTSHPLTQILALEGYANSSCVQMLLGLTGAIETRLMQSRFLDDTALNAHLLQMGSDPAEAFARASGIDRQDAILACRRIGAGIARARLVMSVGLDAKHKRIFLPHSLLKQHGAIAADILAGKSSAPIAAVARAQGELAREQMRMRPDPFTRAEGKALRSLRALAALTLARLNEVEADGYQVAAHRLTLTPLRKLFIAWRTAYFQ